MTEKNETSNLEYITTYWQHEISGQNKQPILELEARENSPHLVPIHIHHSDEQTNLTPILHMEVPQLVRCCLDF